ncbi:hypothetical protein INT45_000475 [Circinella minor]|uniref:DUF1279 domain-containing protein n=1 Tax=Circinella minor TaxID=1195481 RepID=A0A8H7VJI2_9FUNG|nr:hypothetical protein INT45_000475 [Circinella minor]
MSLLLRNGLLQHSHVLSLRAVKTSYKISQPQYHSILLLWKQKSQPRSITSSSWTFRTTISPSRYKVLLRQEQRHRQQEEVTEIATKKSRTGKIKGFMKKYGTVGVGVYLGLSVIDLSLTMALVSYKGADKVKNMEDWVVGNIKRWIGMKHDPDNEEEEMKEEQHEKVSFTTLFVIAYGIHKTILLPVRLSLTAAITPIVARRLRELGWIKKIVK